MIEHVHDHVVSELQQSAKTDTVFVVSAVLFNLVVLGISWSVAEAGYQHQRSFGEDAILALLLGVTIVINTFSIRALIAGRETRLKLLAGLIAMYRDNGVEKYYDASLLDSYSTRYRLFTAVIVSLALIALVVPILERFLG